MLVAMPLLAATVDDIQRAIGKLGHEQFAQREEAQQQLLKLAETDHKAVLAACVSPFRQSEDPEVKMRLKELMATVVDKYLFRAPRGYLGVRLNRVHVRGGQLVIAGTAVPPGAVWVSQVLDDSGAQKAGLQANDFIIAVDGKQWENGPDGFIEYVQTKRPGEHLKLSIVRGTTTNAADAVLGELPATEAERIYTKENGDEFFRRWLAEQTESKKP
jgi:C-terminal processing protease CtpA/Prc